MAQPKGSLIRAVWVAGLFGLGTALLSLMVLVLAALGLMGPAAGHRAARLWARILLWGGGVSAEVEGLDNLPEEGGFILAANHRSAADIPVLLAALPLDFRWLAKDSLFRLPLMGQAMRACGYLPVNREDSAKALGLLKAAARQIRAGVKVVVFPEGTRNRSGRGLLPFKQGGFLLARLSGRPVVPAAILGTAAILAPKSHRPRPGRALIRLGRPLDPADGRSLPSRTETALKELLAEENDS